MTAADLSDSEARVHEANRGDQRHWPAAIIPILEIFRDSAAPVPEIGHLLAVARKAD